MEKTVFQKIIDREIPADILYEDDETLAAVMSTVRKVAPAVRDAVGAKGVHINSNHGEAAGQVIFHLHFHIIPRHDRSEFEFWPQIQYTEGEAATIAEKIRSELS